GHDSGSGNGIPGEVGCPQEPDADDQARDPQCGGGDQISASGVDRLTGLHNAPHPSNGRTPSEGGALVSSATIALVRHPDATNSAPWVCAAARNALPAASIKVTPLRSRRRTGLRSVANVRCQQSSASRTQGPANLPSSWRVMDSGAK